MKTVMNMLMLAGMFAIASPVMADLQQPADGHSGMNKGAAAEKAEARVEKRVEKQEKRIARKLKKKKITQEQADKMTADVEAVKAKAEGMKKDGKISKEDRKEIKKALNDTSKEIKAAGQGAASPAPAGH